jgi:hypothetical protein
LEISGSSLPPPPPPPRPAPSRPRRFVVAPPKLRPILFLAGPACYCRRSSEGPVGGTLGPSPKSATLTVTIILVSLSYRSDCVFRCQMCSPCPCDRYLIIPTPWRPSKSCSPASVRRMTTTSLTSAWTAGRPCVDTLFVTPLRGGACDGPGADDAPTLS